MGNIAHKLYGGLRMVQVCPDWPKWFREYFTRCNDERGECYQLRGGYRLHTRRNRMDLHMLDEIWAFRKYDYFGHRVAPGETVVDIGAHIGTFALYAAGPCQASKVISFEPHPDNFRLLERNVSENGLSGQIICVNEGVAGERGSAVLQVVQGNSGGHFLGSSGGDQAVEVSCCTLADVVDRFRLDAIDYLKLDCEGAEYDIIGSASDDLLERIRRISMEYHEYHLRGHRPEEIGDRLRGLGFDVREYAGHRLYARRRT